MKGASALLYSDLQPPGRGKEEGAMAENTRKGITRREFIKHTGAGLLAAGLGTDLIIPRPARAAEKTLKILQ